MLTSIDFDFLPISSQPGGGTILNGVMFGEVTTKYIIQNLLPSVNDSVVTVIQEDEKNKGDFVIATHTAIYKLSTPTSGYVITPVAGHDTEAGFQQGNGIESRFDRIYGMVQIIGGYLVSDHRNHCVRKVDKDSNLQTTTYAGECTESGDQEGQLNSARFNGPFGIRLHLGSIYITDSYNQKIKKLDMTADTVTTIHRSENHELCDFVIGRREDVDEFYVTAKHGVLHVLDRQETWLVGSTKTSSDKTDGQFSGVKFNEPIGIEWLDNRTLLVASAHESVLRVVNTETWRVFSICQCKLTDRPKV